jgi:outer membrane protein insertion porin family
LGRPAWKRVRHRRAPTSYFLFFFCLLSSLFYLLSPSPAYADEIIKSIEIQNQILERRPDILALIRMKEGDPFNRDKMENAIYDLRKWGVFKNVEAIVKHEGNSVSLIFQLEDAYILKDIEIHGNFPLLEKKVKRAIFFSTGDVFNEEKIPEQIGRMISFYEKEGYKDTVVFIEQVRDEPHRMVTLKLNIKKRKHFRLGEVTVRGNTVFWDSRLKNKLFSFSGYSPSKVKKGLEKIDELYQKNGYPRVRAKIVETHFDEEKQRVDLTLEIREGKRSTSLLKATNINSPIP